MLFASGISSCLLGDSWLRQAFRLAGQARNDKKKQYQPSPFQPESLFYNKEQDFYICPMGQPMIRIGTRQSKTASGYVIESARYKAQRCEGCPLKGSCFKAKGDRIIEVNYRLNKYKRRARERLTSEEGIKHRGKRGIEPEAVFGQMKYNMAYRRFRHVGKDKVTMDFAFFAMAFNIKKLCAKLKNKAIQLLCVPVLREKSTQKACLQISRGLGERYNEKIAA